MKINVDAYERKPTAVLGILAAGSDMRRGKQWTRLKDYDRLRAPLYAVSAPLSLDGM